MIEAERELPVGDGGEIAAFLVHGLRAFIANRQRGTRPPEHVDQSDLLNPQIVEPKSALLAAPNPGIDLHFVVAHAVEADDGGTPVAGRIDANRHWGERSLLGKHLDLKAAGRLEVLGFEPDSDAVATVWPDRHLEHHAAVAVGELAEVFKPQRGRAFLEHLSVDEAHLARLVVEPATADAVARVVLESAVGNLDRGIGLEACFLPFDDEPGFLHGEPFGQVPIAAQKTAAVACRKDDRDDLQSVFGAGPFDFLQSLEIVGRLSVETIEAPGQHHAVEPMLRRGLRDPADVLDVLVLVHPRET